MSTALSAVTYGDKGRPDERQKVEEAIDNWRADIVILSDYADSLDAGHGSNDGQAAVDASRDEIVQLQILAKVSNLRKEGQDAAKQLEHDLPEVSALYEFLANRGNKGNDDSKGAFERLVKIGCDSALPNIQILWNAASEAVSAKKSEHYPMPEVCKPSNQGTKTHTWSDHATRTSEKHDYPTKTDNWERPTHSEGRPQPTQPWHETDREPGHETQPGYGDHGNERPTRTEDNMGPTRTGPPKETDREPERPDRPKESDGYGGQNGGHNGGENGGQDGDGNGDRKGDSSSGGY